MSSIASITTFGFGSYSTINLAVALGYGPNSTPPTPPSVASVPGPADGINEKRKLLAKIKWLKAKKQLKEKERRQLALYEHQVKQEEIKEQFETVTLQKFTEPTTDPSALQLFKNITGPVIAKMAPITPRIFDEIAIDDSDLEIEEWLMLGD